jgi:hypothetical protein
VCSCPLHFAVIAASRDVHMNEVWETVGDRRTTRNAISLLMHRTSSDSAKNVCSVVHVFLDAGVSPSCADSGAPSLHEQRRTTTRFCMPHARH